MKSHTKFIPEHNRHRKCRFQDLHVCVEISMSELLHDNTGGSCVHARLKVHLQRSDTMTRFLLVLAKEARMKIER
jgi:hypothetical protein